MWCPTTCWRWSSRRRRRPGLEVSATGGLAIGEAISAEVEEGILRAETISIPLTILIQVIVFGGLIAAGVPLLVAALAIVGAMAVVFLLSTGSFQCIFAVNIITMLGLGLGIDYSLFMVARFREEIRRAAGGARRSPSRWRRSARRSSSPA